MIRSSNSFNFGKWKHFTAGEVARRDPTYIYYCENTGGHTFTPKVKRIAREALARRRARFRALEAMEEGTFSHHVQRPDFY